MQFVFLYMPNIVFLRRSCSERTFERERGTQSSSFHAKYPWWSEPRWPILAIESSRRQQGFGGLQNGQQLHSHSFWD